MQFNFKTIKNLVGDKTVKGKIQWNELHQRFVFVPKATNYIWLDIINLEITKKNLPFNDIVYPMPTNDKYNNGKEPYSDLQKSMDKEVLLKRTDKQLEVLNKYWSKWCNHMKVYQYEIKNEKAFIIKVKHEKPNTSRDTLS